MQSFVPPNELLLLLFDELDELEELDFEVVLAGVTDLLDDLLELPQPAATATTRMLKSKTGRTLNLTKSPFLLGGSLNWALGGEPDLSSQ